MALVHRASGFTGTLVRIEGGGVELRGRTGQERVFRLAPGAFAVDGRAVSLVRPAAPPVTGPGPVTASGSVAVGAGPARVARAGRLWVEGVHDAELVERVWGDDLRVEGVVVERLDGIDHLDRAIDRFRPGPARRLGVLVDHLVPGSKESRIADGIRRPDVLVTGTPFVDVWQAVRAAGARDRRLAGDPEGDRVEGRGVRRPRASATPRRPGGGSCPSVSTYADLEPALVGAVERLIDFVDRSHLTQGPVVPGGQGVARPTRSRLSPRSRAGRAGCSPGGSTTVR